MTKTREVWQGYREVAQRRERSGKKNRESQLTAEKGLARRRNVATVRVERVPGPEGA